MLRSSNRDPRSELDASALDEANAYATPTVQSAGSEGVNILLGVAALAMLGYFVFNQMSEGRRQASIDQLAAETRIELEAAQAQAAEARQAAERARADAAAAQRRNALAQNRPAAVAPPPRQLDRRPQQSSLRSPALVVDNSRPEAAPADPPADGASSATSIDGLTASDLFAQRVNAGGLEPVRATMINDLSRVAPQGTIISGVLETAINSDLPGYTRAVVSEDVRSLDNSTILIPRGSRLIGQYRSGLAIGESRAFVIWTRLITPTGVSVQLTSPATDTLGRAGLTGKVDRHFFQRFGSAILLSVVSAGTNAALYGGDADVIIASTSEAQSVAAQALSQQINIPPTIKVRQGTEIRIFLARDLFFPGVSASQELRP